MELDVGFVYVTIVSPQHWWPVPLGVGLLVGDTTDKAAIHSD